jgi:hypothetical protein
MYEESEHIVTFLDFVKPQYQESESMECEKNWIIPV